MAGKKKSYNRVKLFGRMKSYAQKIESVEDEVRLIIENLRQHLGELSKEQKASKLGLQLQRDTHLLHLISLRLTGAGVMLYEFPKERSRIDSVARDF